MIFGGLQKLTTLDFPGVVSALVFTQGCNFHCPYCHNSRLIPASPPPGGAPAPGLAEVLAFLEKRRGLLDGVAISGGEPCLQKDLEPFCREARSLGYKIKLDTNGSFPHVLERLLAASLLDHVAVDVKADPAAYAPGLTNTPSAGEKLRETLALLAASGVPFEARTTCVHPFVSTEALPGMAAIIPDFVPWFFQRANLEHSRPAMRALDDHAITSCIAKAQITHARAALRE